MVGRLEGGAEGDFVGCFEGSLVGRGLGAGVGFLVGRSEGASVKNSMSGTPYENINEINRKYQNKRKL